MESSAADDALAAFDTRGRHCANGWSPGRLDQMADTPQLIDWASTHPDLSATYDTLHDWLREVKDWKHHHGLMALETSPYLDKASAEHTERLENTVRRALVRQNASMANNSFLDLAAGEGAIANRLFDFGARDVDACDQNPQNVKRIWKLRAVTGRRFGRVGLVDTENLLWHRSFERNYDIVVALGPAFRAENPALFCRNLREITSGFAIVQADPFAGDTTLEPPEGSLVTRRNSARDNSGERRFLTEVRPNARALADLLLNAGFQRVEQVRSAHSDERDLAAEVLIAVVDDTSSDDGATGT